MTPNGFWISFAFTMGIFIGQYLPKLIEYLLERWVGK